MIKYIRYKTGLASETSYSNIDGYRTPILAINQPLQKLKTPEKEGIYMLCVISQMKDGRWQAPDRATLMLHKINNTAPNLKPLLLVNENWEVYTLDKPYKITTVKKFGPKSI